MATLSPNQSLPFPSSPSQRQSPTPSPTRSSNHIPMSRSGSYSLSSPNLSQSRSPSFSTPATRTMAILIGSANVHRLAIQSRLNQAGFEILAERLEHWSPEDDDFLSEFLVHERENQVETWKKKLTNSPLYVMVLERSNCSETWWSMIGLEPRNGDQDEEDLDLDLDENGLPVPRKGTLKTTYGDLFYGSTSSEAAERQIGICFPEIASPSALKSLAREGFNTLSNPNEKDEHQLMLNSEDVVWDEEGLPYDSRTGQPLDLQEEFSYSQPMVKSQSGNNVQSNSKSSVIFRARPLPASINSKPSIQPRLSRAAALRMGIELPKVPRRNASDATSQSSGSGGEKVGISGKPKAEVPVPKSLSKPNLAPRLNKAAAARMGVETESNATVREKKEADFSNTPGHKRASTGIKLASLAAPSIKPRGNLASQARNGQSPQKETANRTSPVKERKPVDFSNTPGHRRLSTGPKPSSLAAPAIAPRTNRASSARGARVEGEIPSGMTEEPHRQRLSSAPTNARACSAWAGSTTSPSKCDSPERPRKEVDYSNTPGHRRQSFTSTPIASLAEPSLPPRLNNAANARLRRGSVGSLQEFETSNLGQIDVNSNFRKVGGGGNRPSSRQSNFSDAHQDGMPAPARKKIGGTAPPSAYRHSVMALPTSRPVSRGSMAKV